MDIVKLGHHISHYLEERNIQPRDVHIVFDVPSSQVAWALECAIKQDAYNLVGSPVANVLDLQVHGIMMRIESPLHPPRYRS